MQMEIENMYIYITSVLKSHILIILIIIIMIIRGMSSSQV